MNEQEELQILRDLLWKIGNSAADIKKKKLKI
jgi:hypothetical protein